MNKIKLIALDIDGTLLNDEREVTLKNLQAIEKAKNAGIKVVLDTGRPPISTVEFLEKLQLIGEGHYSITYNGGRIEENNGKIIAQTMLSHEDILKTYEVAGSFQLPIDVIAGDDCYTIENERKSLVHYVNNTLTFINTTINELPEEADFYKVILSADEAYINQAYEQFPKEFLEAYEVVKTCPILLEVMPKNVTKASGLEQLCAYLKINRQEVLSMGDEKNDVSMLEWAGLGIAPKNAILEAKEAADFVSDYTNEESAVADAIHRFVLD